MFRRIAHRGFSNYPFKKEYSLVNLCDIEVKYADGETVNKETLVSKGLVKKSAGLIKVLGNGDLTKKVSVVVDKVSASAKEKIEKEWNSISDGVSYILFVKLFLITVLTTILIIYYWLITI